MGFSGAMQSIGIPVSHVAWQEQGLEQFFYKVVQQADEEQRQSQNSSTGQGGAKDGNMAR